MHIRKRLQELLHSNSFPILVLLTVNVVTGLFVFQDYGLSLDEPLFYGYADAIGYAYSPDEWVSGDFDLIRAYGPSPGDHANRGPAYLLLARIPAHLLQRLGLDLADSWHLVNFLMFQIGVYYFYRFCLRWMKPLAALGATAFFSTQPILWEHAFINPKDPPFLVFFLITLELGFGMADKLAHPRPGETSLQTLGHILVPALLLGLTTNIRVLGPLAAALGVMYFLTLRKPKRILWYLPYALIAYSVMVLTWPFLWDAPIAKFIRVVQFMADNPTDLRVFFYGQIYRADALPLRYLPSLMLFTLTEPVWPLAGLGFITAVIRSVRGTVNWKSLTPTLGWLAIPFVYVLVRRPPMYDGFRHFLFITPPLFVLGGLALDSFLQWIKHSWVKAAVLVLILVPGIISGYRLHPYQYTYYNQFVGGTGEAAYRFETDFWLTCYKDAVANMIPFLEKPVTKLYVKRESYLAAYYAPEQIVVIDSEKNLHLMEKGDYLLMNSRANPGLQRFRDPSFAVIRVERDGALFCVAQRK